MSDANHEWEILENSTDCVRRMIVPGGWLYQVERRDTAESVVHGAAPVYTTGWHPPVFVQEVVK